MVEDHELGVLLSLDGFEFQFGRGYRVRLAAQRVAPSPGRPQGIKYSLTLHDPDGRRIYGLDNAHATRKRGPEFDHCHAYGSGRLVPYRYRGPAGLLEDSIAR